MIYILLCSKVSKTTLCNVGTSSHIPDDLNLENELDVVDTNAFDSDRGSESDVDYARKEKKLMQSRKQVRTNEDGAIYYTFFYGQTFGFAKEIK